MVVVVDEAYLEFVRMDDAVDGVATYRAHANVIVTRTFSKAYGLAGFRVGYAIAQAPLAGALRAVSLPFGVSSVAQAAAIASLEAEPELLERVDALVAERARVVAGIRDAGWEVPDAQGNFVWFGLGERTGDFAAAADELGIVVRPVRRRGRAGDDRGDRGQRPAARARADLPALRVPAASFPWTVSASLALCDGCNRHTARESPLRRGL